MKDKRTVSNTFILFPIVVLLGLAAVAIVLAVMPVDLAHATPPAGSTPPTVDGLLDSSYIYDGRTADPNTPGGLYHFYNDDTCFYALVVDRAFNDNVFGPYPGTVEDGWPMQGSNYSHIFKDLEQSDHAVFSGIASGCEVKLDYIYRSGDVWFSGIGGPDSAITGTCPAVSAATSMYYNATQSQYGLANFPPTASSTKNWTSPALDYNGTTADDYYEWNMIYEFSVPKPAEGCGTLVLANSHNSPSKEDKNQPDLARLGNYVWYDRNRDGIQGDPSVEPGLADICVDLYKLNGDVWEFVRTTQTDFQGIYWFNYLQPGTYYVDPDENCIPNDFCHTLNVEQVPNDLGSMPDPGSPEVCGEEPQGSGSLLAITGVVGDHYEIELGAGETYPNADFGYVLRNPTGVGLASFDAVPQNGAILVTWETAFELDTLGFNLYRAESSDGPWTLLNEGLIFAGALANSQSNTYEFPDGAVMAGDTYYYQLEILGTDGHSSLYGPVIGTPLMPSIPDMPYRLFIPFVTR